MTEALYMLIDYTSVESTAVLKVAPLRQIQLWGAIYNARGRMVMAPPVAARSFAKFDGGTLQYLYWNLCGEVPPDMNDYQHLVQRCLEKLNALPVDDSTEAWLEAELAKLDPTGTSAASGEDAPVKVKAKREASGEAPNRPGGETTTGKVWRIADELMASSGAIPNRKEVVAACEKEGINPSTASTQYGKWVKGSK